MDVYTPYLCGRVKAFCMKTLVYDLIIGNVEGASNANAPDPHWDAERCAVTTSRQAKIEGQTIPLKVAKEVDLAVINPEKLKELQEADPTLHRYRNKEESVMMRGKEITFVTRKGIFYGQCETPGDEKPILQVVVPGGPRHILKELWTENVDVPETKTSYQFVFELREKLEDTLELARAEPEKAYNKGKYHYDCKEKPRKFRTGDKVLLLLPTDNNKLLMQWKDPYVIQEVVDPNDYKVKVGRGLKAYHANLLK